MDGANADDDTAPRRCIRCDRKCFLRSWWRYNWRFVILVDQRELRVTYTYTDAYTYPQNTHPNRGKTCCTAEEF